MVTTLDSAGRVREREELIEIEPAATPMSLEMAAGGPVAVPAEELPPLTDEIVRATLGRMRR